MDTKDIIYLDHSATTPVDPQVLDAMQSVLSKNYGNPSSMHQLGQEGAKLIDDSRSQIAQVLSAARSEIVFTSGGTESDNSAIKGAAFALKEQGNHIITTSIEHHAVLHTCEWLEKFAGFDVTYLNPDKEGFINPKQIIDAITDQTTVVSIMYVNNEIGVIEPIGEIAKALRDYQEKHNRKIVLHSDAVQAAGWLSLDVDELGVDMMSLSAHKFYGPKGVGILYIKEGTPYAGYINGGSQENNRRAGTENTAGIVGIGVALSLAEENRPIVVPRVSTLRDRLLRGILKIPDIYINGPESEGRIANNINVSIKGIEIESLIINLDMLGVAVSSGSACTSGSVEPSHVLLGLGLPTDLSSTSLRITLGKGNTEEHINTVQDNLPDIIERIRLLKKR